MTEFLTLLPREQQLIKLGMGANLTEVWNPDYEIPLFAPQRLTSDGDGASDGTTIICSDLVGLSDYNGYRVRIVDKTSAYCNEERLIDQATTGGTIHVSSAFGGRIISGVDFWIIGKKTNAIGPHNSDLGIDLRLHNYLRIWLDNRNMNQDASVQLKGSHVEDSAQMVDVGAAFVIPANDYGVKCYDESDGLLPWEEVEVTFAGAPAEAVFFVYAILKNV